MLNEMTSKRREYYKVRYKANRNKILSRIRAYQKTHKKERNAYERERRKIDSKFKLNGDISGLIRRSLKGNKNGNHWEDLVGYTLNDLKKHLEKRFTEGMSWDNHGLKGWAIDHKILIAAFNFTSPNHRDFKRCWALKNLQPMWAKDNQEKSNKLDKPFQPSLLI